VNHPSREARHLERDQHVAQREEVILSCYAASQPQREQFSEPRAYLDDSDWYTTCEAPQPGDDDFPQPLERSPQDLTVPPVGSALVAVEAVSRSPAPPPEPPPAPPPLDYGTSKLEHAPCDSGCNLPITNPQTVDHFQLTPVPWPTPRWIKFGNGKRECSTHFADFGPIIGKVAIIASAPDTLISVSVLCRKGLEVVFKIPGGPGIYLQGVLLYQGTVDPSNDMFYVNIKDLLSLSITFQNPDRFTACDSVHTPGLPTPLAEEACSYSVKKAPRQRSGITADKIRQVLWLHKRLGHPSRDVMAKAINDETWLGVPSDITAADVNATFAKTSCTACQLAKSNRQPRGEGAGTHPEFPGQVIAVDYQGTITPTSVRGFNGFYIFKCLYSAYRHVIMTTDKTAETFNEAVAHVVDFYNIHGHVVKKFRFDAGSTENSQTSAGFFAQHRIEVDPAAPESQFQNPVEREVQTANKGIAALLIDQSALGSRFWCYAAESWVQTANATYGAHSSSGASPLELVTGIVPDIAAKFNFPFGCPVTSHKTETASHHYDTHAEFGIAVGSSRGANRATLVYIPTKGTRAWERLDVRALKFAQEGAATEVEKQALAPVIGGDWKSIEFKSSAPAQDLAAARSRDDRIGTLGLHAFDIPAHSLCPRRTPSHNNIAPCADPQRRVTRAATSVSRAMQAPTSTSDENCSYQAAYAEDQWAPPDSESDYSCFATKAIVRTANNPTLCKAQHGDEWDSWKSAVAEEMHLLSPADLHCYDTVSRRDVPRGAQILQSKMDLKTKYTTAGEFLKRKARLVCLGNRETPDPTRDLFSPTVNNKTINLMFALAAQHGLKLRGLDIYGAFITADIDEPVYMQLPKGLEKDIDGEPPIWKLRKTLYGLRRSPKAFYDQLTEYLEGLGYIRSVNDRCLFHKHFADGRKIMFCIHVDDFAVAASNDSLIDQLCTELKGKYIVKESDTLEDFLGVHMEQAAGRLHLSQPGLIKKLIEEAKLGDDTRVALIPMRTDWNDDEQDAAPPCTGSNFRTLLGMLIFLLRTRPDIAYAVNRLATRCASATTRDIDAIHEVIRYLKHTQRLELTYETGSAEQATTIGRLYGWADAAYACHRDGRSHSGTCLAYGSTTTGKFSSTSKKQSVTCLSSTEAELYAAVEATKDIIYLRAILAELGFPQLHPTTLYADNQSMITLASNYSGNAKRVKHFLVRVNFMIEQVAKQVIRLEYLSTHDHPADAGTKPLSRVPLEKMRGLQLGQQREREA